MLLLHDRKAMTFCGDDTCIISSSLQKPYDYSLRHVYVGILQLVLCNFVIAFRNAYSNVFRNAFISNECLKVRRSELGTALYTCQVTFTCSIGPGRQRFELSQRGPFSSYVPRVNDLHEAPD